MMAEERHNAMPTRLKVECLTKAFFGVPVLHGIAFEAHAGEVLGFVGENGSGKSTTMNLLAGVLRRDSGAILLEGEPYVPIDRRDSAAAGIAFIQQELNIFANLTVAENLCLGDAPRVIRGLPFISRTTLRARSLKLLKSVGLDVSPDALAGALSAGQRQLLEIARALSGDPRIIIFDEPTTSLTSKECERLFGIIERLKSRGVAIIYISHALDDVLRLADRLVVMRDGRVTLRALRSGMTAERLVTAMVGRSIEALFPERPALDESSSVLLDVEGIGQPGIVSDISLRVRKGEVVGIAGLMGSGRSELARILFGLDPHSAGTIRIGGRALPSGDPRSRLDSGMAFLTEDRRNDGLMMNASVADNMALAALPLFAAGANRRIDQQRLRDRIHSLAQTLDLKSGPLHATAARTLSGGNQQKVVLGRWLLRNPALFILDEPTRGVDIGAKEEIYRLLAGMAEAGMGVVIISSELEELMGLCDRILVMRRGRLVAEHSRVDFDQEKILKAAFGQKEAA